MKRKLPKQLKKEAWRVFSIFIRTRDCLRTTGCASWGLCITCQKRYHFKLLQAGHFIPGRHLANLFYERGCHAQCYNCNINLKGNTLKYIPSLLALYGHGIIEELEENDEAIIQIKPAQYEEIIQKYIMAFKEQLK